MADPEDSTMMASIPDPAEFTADVEMKLGRANGNTYNRISGVEGVHDGQILVRLKKKRFVALDYSIQPTQADSELAQGNAGVKIPKGAGKEICKNPECNKVGVPVCVFDSDPDQPDPLYLRTGLCFSCQRNLNEKRRTERKRPNCRINMLPDGNGERPSLIYAIGPTSKKFKYKDGNIVEVMADAVIVNGAVEGTRHYGEGYGFQEIGMDLLNVAREGFTDTDRLIHSVSSSAATAVAAVGDSTEAATSAVGGANAPDPTSSVYSSEDVNTLYNKAFQSLNKSIFLLTQWKAAWDGAFAAAQETVADPSLADAVASAAAVVAAAATSSSAPEAHSDPSSANMVSLLRAADKREEDEKLLAGEHVVKDEEELVEYSV